MTTSASTWFRVTTNEDFENNNTTMTSTSSTSISTKPKSTEKSDESIKNDEKINYFTSSWPDNQLRHSHQQPQLGGRRRFSPRLLSANSNSDSESYQEKINKKSSQGPPQAQALKLLRLNDREEELEQLLEKTTSPNPHISMDYNEENQYNLEKNNSVAIIMPDDETWQPRNFPSDLPPHLQTLQQQKKKNENLDNQNFEVGNENNKNFKARKNSLNLFQPRNFPSNQQQQKQEEEKNTKKKFTINGKIYKSNPKFENPSEISIQWFNFLEQGIFRPNSKIAWSRIGGKSIINQDDFTLEMELHQEHFHQNITFLLAPKLQFSEEFDHDQVRFAMGFIFGIYEENVGEIRTFKDFNEVSKIGKSGEEVYADQYAIFYKSGRFLHNYYEENSIFAQFSEECDWTVDIPQGFSCGKREIAKDGCPDEKFVSMECSNIVINIE